MPFSEIFPQIGPSQLLYFFPMLFVFCVDDNGRVATFNDQIGNERFLRSEVGRIPVERHNRLTLPTAPDYAAD